MAGESNVVTVQGGASAVTPPAPTPAAPVAAPAAPAPETQKGKVREVFKQEEAREEAAFSGQPEVKGAEEKPREEKEGTPAGGEITPDLRQRARDVGLGSDDLEGLPPTAVERLVRVAESKLMALGRLAPSTLGEEDQEAEQAPKPKTSKVKKFEIQGIDKFDEELGKVLGGLNDHYANQLEAVTAQLEERETVRFRESVIRDVDSALDRVSKDFGGVFGDSWNEMGEEAVRARSKVFDEALAMAVGYERAGRKVPPIRTLAMRAAKALFGDSAKAAARADIEQNIKERELQAIARPTHQRAMPANASPRDRAAVALDKKLEEIKARNNKA
jgi:hypothetical protein